MDRSRWPSNKCRSHISHPGRHARLLTALGSDPAARIASEDLARHEVDVVDLHTGGAFPVALVTVDSSSRRSVVSRNSVGLTTRRLTDKDLSGDHSVLVIDRHGFSLIENSTFSRDGVTVVADLGTWNQHSEAILRFADITVVPVSGLPEGERNHPVDFVTQHGGVRFILTSGVEPIVVCDGNGMVQISVPNVSTVDSLGAGDIFVGALSFHLDHLPLLDAVSLASVMASQSCATRSPRVSTNGVLAN